MLQIPSTKKFRMKRIILTSVLILTALSAKAQESMTLRECMEFAVSNSTQVRIQQANTDDARLDRRNAILAAFTPTIDAGGNAYGSWGRTIDPKTNTINDDPYFKNAWSAQASIMLFDGFSAVNNIKIAKTALEIGYSRDQQEEDKVCLATMEAFFNVLYYTELVNILQKQVDNATASVKLASRQEELGTKGHADVVQMKADLADKQYELINATNERENAKITLEDVMFWPIDEELVIDTDIESLDAINGGGTEILSVDDIVGNAMASLPAISIARDNIKKAQKSFDTAKWRTLPRISLDAGWNTNYYTYPGKEGYTSINYWTMLSGNAGEYVQVSLKIPIYDKLNRATEIKKKKNALSRANLEYDKTVRDVEAEIHKAVQDRDGAEAAMFQAQRRSEVQDEAYRLNSRKFEQGLISSIEFNTASANFLKAEAEYLYARLKYQLKRRVVSYYNGVRYIDQ